MYPGTVSRTRKGLYNIASVIASVLSAMTVVADSLVHLPTFECIDTLLGYNVAPQYSLPRRYSLVFGVYEITLVDSP
jgi:hypothetical protein